MHTWSAMEAGSVRDFHGPFQSFGSGPMGKGWSVVVAGISTRAKPLTELAGCN